MHQHTEYHTFKDYIPIDRNKTTMLILQFLEKIKYQNIARMSQFRPNMLACLGSDILTTSSRKAPTGNMFYSYKGLCMGQTYPLTLEKLWRG